MDNANGQLNIPPNANEEEKAKAYSGYFGIPFINLKGKNVDFDVFQKIPYDVSSSFGIIAFEHNDDLTPPVLKIAVADPSRLQKKAPAILSELKKQKGINIELAIITKNEFERLLADYKKDIDEKNNKNEIKDENPKNTTNTEAPKTTAGDQYPLVDLRQIPLTYQVLNKFPEEIATRYKMVVFEASDDNKIKVAAINPGNKNIKGVLDFVKKRNNLDVELYETSQPSLEFALRRYRNVPPEPAKEKKLDYETPTPSPAVAPIAKPMPSYQTDVAIEKNPVAPITTKPAIPAEKNEPKKIDNDSIDKNISKVTEIGLSEVTSADLTQQDQSSMEATGANISTEEEKNLDKIIPEGITSINELAEIIKKGFIPKTLAAIIYLAVANGASDIHIESGENSLRLRFRIDGLLKDMLKMPIELQAPIVSRIKILAKLKIDETRIPQDGRFDVKLKDKDIDLRVSTLPTVRGEKAVLRILDKSSQMLNLTDLGVEGRGLEIVNKNITKPYGIILSTGPTGSGKSTTLYSILNKISKPEINIVTLEDPVEYEIPGINQCQIKPKIGFTFADGLRSILRQDPDVIMVGEIRDQETASMATHAALTGHLVLTTLHTNDTASALPRLINMGVEPFLITSAINCIMAQRLVRKICPKCKEEYQIPEATKNEIIEIIKKSTNNEFKKYQNTDVKFYHGKGCSNCSNGYKGRIGLFEIMDMTEKVESLAVAKSPATTIKHEAMKEGMLTIKEDGIIKIIKGITTIDEVMRVTTE